MKKIAFGLILFVSTTAHVLATKNVGYEVWASDQSNSVSGVADSGILGSYLWIWDSADIERQLAGGPDAKPIGCGRNKRGKDRGKARSNVGPCDLLDVFPQKLRETDAAGVATGNTLAQLDGFGRLHGMLPDPQNQYVTANIFAPGGGFVGIIDTSRKEAIALFRATGTNAGGSSDARSVHMSFWTTDGSAIIVANLNGKVLERIDIKRNRSGKIKSAKLNLSASLGVGKNMAVTSAATVFRGRNANGRRMIGSIVGDYADGDFNNLTPNGVCKENDCLSGPDASGGGRPNNVIICPIPSTAGNAYITMGGGGLLIANTGTTPMSIVGEYGDEFVNGAGCGGAQTNTDMWINAGVSAAAGGATQSTFSMYLLDDSAYSSGFNSQNSPLPTEIFKDPANTATTGNISGDPTPNTTGQLPGVSTRRDAHGVAVTVDSAYVHNVDRIQNTVEVFNSNDHTRTSYDLVSADGQGNGVGPCAAKSVTDDAGLPGNDPAPDLLERTPDGKYLAIGFRGPAPVSVKHSAQGSCPGVGIVELLNGGAGGRLAGVLRTTNTVDTSTVSAPNGHPYSGAERSDIHAATVVRKHRHKHKQKHKR